MRKLNLKLFLLLVVGSVATAGSVWGLHTFQYKRIAAALLWQARRAEEVGKIDQMARYLERYLEFAPQDVDQQVHLGRTLAGDSFAASPPARRQASSGAGTHASRSFADPEASNATAFA